MPPRRTLAAAASAAVGLGGLAVVATPSPALANPDGTDLVISEVYGGNGSAGALYRTDFVELYNPTSSAISLSGRSLQYRATSNTGTPTTSAVTDLTPAGSVGPGQYFVVQLARPNTQADSVDVPNVDYVGNTSTDLSGSNGQVFLADATTGVDADGAGGTAVTDPAVIDFVGYGTAAVKEGSAAAPAPTPPATTSVARKATPTDTDVNGTDFAVSDPPTPGEATGSGTVDPPADPVEASIADIQGTGSASELDGDPVITEGVVTASYPTGGLAGFFMQTPGEDDTPDASDGIFVYTAAAAPPAVGDSVEVAGDVDEYFGLTQVVADTVTDIADLGDVVPNTVVPGTDCELGDCPTGNELDAAREEVEGEAFDLDGDFTVTDNYDGSPYFEEQTSNASGNFGEIGLAAESTEPLVSPTEVVNVGADATPEEEQQLADREDYNEAHRLVLDDGSSWNYALGGGHTDDPFPWYTADHAVRVGADVSFDEPVVLTWTFSNWKLSPPEQVVGVPEGITFEQTRAEESAPQDVGGDLTLATFNVLNFFPTTGEEYEADGGSCDYFVDRDGDDVTVDDCGADGPRGAADDANLERQRDKIVAAIDALDADVVSLEELENSVKLGKDRDFAIGQLVDALNEEAGAGTWDYAPSPDAADLPAVAEQDVIRMGFIYRPDTVELVGGSTVLVGDERFSDAREPVAQAFKAAGGDDEDAFLVIANHFKSKSGTDDGTGQGGSNPRRVGQAEALIEFADDVTAEAGLEKVFLTGDFNSYTEEDPINVLVDAGYTNLESDTAGEESYSFDGEVGSLDHVFANAAALDDVTGTDIWTINAYESVYYEYSRFNYNVTDLYDTSPFRSSDHNPEIVGIDVPDVDGPTEPLAPSISTGTKPSPVKAGKAATLVVRVVADGYEPTGTVRIKVTGKDVVVRRLENGRATINLPRYKAAGQKSVKVVYSGDDVAGGATDTSTFRVVRKKG